MRHIYLTTIGGRPKPEKCFLSGRLRWTLLPQERYVEPPSGRRIPNLPVERRTLSLWVSCRSQHQYYFLDIVCGSTSACCISLEGHMTSGALSGID